MCNVFKVHIINYNWKKKYMKYTILMDGKITYF